MKRIVTQDELEKVSEILDVPIDFIEEIIFMRDDIEDSELDFSDIILYIP